jgi:DNA-binding transcriptional MerR regulator
MGKDYRLTDIAREIDRDKSSIIRWEEMGLIPVAERDSRGWRYYTEQQAKHIIKLAKETNYFRNAERVAQAGIKARPQAVYIGDSVTQ